MTGTVAAVAAAATAATAAALLPRARPRLGVRAVTTVRDDTGRPVVREAVGALGAAAVAAALVGGWPGLLAAPVAAAVAWRMLRRLEPRSARRRREALTRALPPAVDLLAAALVAGAGTAPSIQVVARAVGPPLSTELQLVTARLDLGADPSAVWASLARHPELGALGRCFRRSHESGASIADAMLRLSEELRREARAEAETRARAVGVRAAIPLGACLLPAFVLVGVVPLVAGSVARFFMG